MKAVEGRKVPVFAKSPRPRCWRRSGSQPRSLLRRAAVTGLMALLACRHQALPARDVIARIEQAPVRYPEFERYLRENGGGSEMGVQVLPTLFSVRIVT